MKDVFIWAEAAIPQRIPHLQVSYRATLRRAVATDLDARQYDSASNLARR
jgi:hypothetical protein